MKRVRGLIFDGVFDNCRGVFESVYFEYSISNMC